MLEQLAPHESLTRAELSQGAPAALLEAEDLSSRQEGGGNKGEKLRWKGFQQRERGAVSLPTTGIL